MVKWLKCPLSPVFVSSLFHVALSPPLLSLFCLCNSPTTKMKTLLDLFCQRENTKLMLKREFSPVWSFPSILVYVNSPNWPHYMWMISSFYSKSCICFFFCLKPTVTGSQIFQVPLLDYFLVLNMPHIAPDANSPIKNFSYFNNYGLSQPRHFCIKTYPSHWTCGGALDRISEKQEGSHHCLWAMGTLDFLHF